MIVVGYDHQYDLVAVVDSPCPACGRRTRPLYRARKKLTLYWIPTFTLTHLYALKCECSPDRHWEVDEATAQQLLKGRSAPVEASTPAPPSGPAPASAVTVAPAAAGQQTPTAAPTVCVRCRTPLAEGAQFCHGCGARARGRGRQRGKSAPARPAGGGAGSSA